MSLDSRDDASCIHASSRKRYREHAVDNVVGSRPRQMDRHVAKRAYVEDAIDEARSTDTSYEGTHNVVTRIDEGNKDDEYIVASPCSSIEYDDPLEADPTDRIASTYDTDAMTLVHMVTTTPTAMSAMSALVPDGSRVPASPRSSWMISLASPASPSSPSSITEEEDSEPRPLQDRDYPQQERAIRSVAAPLQLTKRVVQGEEPNLTAEHARDGHARRRRRSRYGYGSGVDAKTESGGDAIVVVDRHSHTRIRGRGHDRRPREEDHKRRKREKTSSRGKAILRQLARDQHVHHMIIRPSQWILFCRDRLGRVQYEDHEAAAGNRRHGPVKLRNYCTVVRMNTNAMLALQDAIEQFIVNMYRMIRLCAVHGKRKTLMARDLDLVVAVLQHPNTSSVARVV